MWPACCAPVGNSEAQRGLARQQGTTSQTACQALLHTGTIPDPVVQAQCRQMDEETAEAAATVYRLPILSLWMPLLQFLLRHPDAATDGLPVELAEAAAMWVRMEEYFTVPWTAFSELVLLNAEKELRREIAGEYRYDRGPQYLGSRHAARVAIYEAGLKTASQHPDRVAKLLLKAAGRAPWEEGDASEDADASWRGEWEDDWSSYSRGRWVQPPISRGRAVRPAASVRISSTPGSIPTPRCRFTASVPTRLARRRSPFSWNGRSTRLIVGTGTTSRANCMGSISKPINSIRRSSRQARSSGSYARTGGLRSALQSAS
jgi:hypothetical protein